MRSSLKREKIEIKTKERGKGSEREKIHKKRTLKNIILIIRVD